MKKRVVIIGAGPAGLSAGYELLAKSDDFEVEIYECSNAIGGISQTIDNDGNKMDIGGHRFFSKSQRVMDFWQSILPLETPECNSDEVILLRNRLSRIYFLKRLFNYPLKLDIDLVRNLGIIRCVKIAFSYIKALIFPYKNVDSLEKFYINRFGRELYNLFFRDYTTKVWGISPNQLSPDWGVQRVKGLSIYKAIISSFKPKSKDIHQKGVETSLIERFLYPKFGPGQLYEALARKITQKGGKIYKNTKAIHFALQNSTISHIIIESNGGATREVRADFFISTMAIKDLFLSMPNASQDIKSIATRLEYRDFITMGVLLKSLRKGEIKDNWIYIQEPYVKVARLQFFHNWSESMVANKEHYFVGMEYMCFENDTLWSKSDDEFMAFGINELERLGFCERGDVLATYITRVKKAYPIYSGVYGEFDKVRRYLDNIENLFVCGRNGMHRYNNMDHSILSAFEVAKCILDGESDKSGIWSVNSEESYHEEKS